MSQQSGTKIGSSNNTARAGARRAQKMAQTNRTIPERSSVKRGRAAQAGAKAAVKMAQTNRTSSTGSNQTRTTASIAERIRRAGRASR